LRPGEKLFEELALEEEGAERTGHPKVFIGRIRPHSWDVVNAFVRELEGVVDATEPGAIRRVLHRFIAEYQAPADSSPMQGSDPVRAIASVGHRMVDFELKPS
jgi:FlaA1/EpsC-like NDP-sugar epimerase